MIKIIQIVPETDTTRPIALMSDGSVLIRYKDEWFRSDVFDDLTAQVNSEKAIKDNDLNK